MGDRPDFGRRKLLHGAAVAGASFAAGAWASAQESTVPASDGVPLSRDNEGSVIRFGARGDGRADDTAAVQAAVDQALKAGGGSIHFPSGRYRITRSIVFRSGERVDVTGAGSTSVLLHEEDEPLLMWPTGVSCRESSVRHLSLFSSGKDKSPDTPVILCEGGSERSLFSHLFFKAEGVTMGGGIYAKRVMDTTTVEHCLMWGRVGGTGIRVAQGSEVRIFGARIIGSPDPRTGRGENNIGIHLTGNNGGVHIVTTDLIGLHTGLKVGEPGAPSNRELFITHATLDSSFHGLWQLDHTFTSIAGCWAASSDEDQILLDESAQGALLTIAGGTIFNGGASGRPGAHNGLVVKAGSFLMSGVAVRHNRGTGILTGPNAGEYTITGCRITSNGRAAVLDGNNYTFTANVHARNTLPIEDRGGPNKNVTL